MDPASPAYADRAAEWVAGGTPEPLRSQLVGLLGPDQLHGRALDLIAYASDAGPYRRIPKAVLTPRGIDDVVALLRFARERKTPVTFRAGGTSLNGQAGTEELLVDIRRHWHRVQILDQGERVRVQPGVVLGLVNRMLARYGRKLGPDPASSEIACIGGVLANNSGGMRCGTHADSYSTVTAMKLVLANGAVIDTAAPDAEAEFAAAAPELAAGLEQLRDELRADPELAQRVRHKFQIKNTTGYRLCAFLDADTPLEIFRRLVIGSEGTLAFVAEAELQTVPFGRHAALGLVFFQSVDAACAKVGELVAAGATATELMVAATLIAAGYNFPGAPERWKELPPGSAALMVEFRDDDPQGLDGPERRALEILQDADLVEPPRFTRDAEEIELHWRVREGMQGLIAAMRPPGIALIFEDVCVDPARVAEAAQDLQALLGQYGFLQGLAGHASAGNLHFLLTANFTQESELQRYDAFMAELVELIVGKYDGSLKAEHGTGVNMAPFVEREWGPRATEMMWRVKRLADPEGILNPGVVLNRDPKIHLAALKSTPEVEETVTKCIECGFCEPVCPSRNVTLTPRQRIVIRREIARQLPDSPVARALRDQYQYDGIATCAVDGSCRHACPVAIDTGELIKQLRQQEHSRPSNRLATTAARHYAVAERAARAGLRFAGPLARQVRTSIPQPAAALPPTSRDAASAVYVPACINRIFGAGAGDRNGISLPQAMVTVSARAGLPVWIPADVAGHCCGTPWSSKGYRLGAEIASQRMAEALSRWSDGGRLPVVVDASSCSHALREADTDQIEVLDSIAWVHDHLLPSLNVGRQLNRIAVHPTCATRHLGLVDELLEVAEAIAHEAVVPASSGCCGMAGDRGWIHPELPASALRDIAAELQDQRFDACVSSNRTCELALQEHTGRRYESIVQTLEGLTR